MDHKNESFTNLTVKWDSNEKNELLQVFTVLKKNFKKGTNNKRIWFKKIIS